MNFCSLTNLDEGSVDRFVLRKKPPGKSISPVAHQVDREFRVMKALGTVKGFPVPKVFHLCIDDTIIGTQFYVCRRPVGEDSRFLLTVEDLGHGVCQR
jgi:aminoglycoside phosphotransferase (APT) family kinase protein